MAGRETIQRRGGCNGAAWLADGVEVMTTPTMTWRRLTRRPGRDRNPLRRRSDVIEAWLLPILMIAFVALSPVAGAAAGLRARAGNVAAHRAEQSWHRAAAVLLQASPGPLFVDGGANTWLVWTPARWTSGGRQRLGDVPAAAGTRAGSTVPVWLDRAGNVQSPPLSAAQGRHHIISAVSLALAALAVLLGGLALLTRRLLNWRRLAGWEAGWRSVSPQWSQRS
jgi:hypothetical protein